MNKNSVLVISILMTAAYLYLLSGLPIRHYNVLIDNVRASESFIPTKVYVGDCVALFLINKSEEPWEKDRQSLDSIYKITQVGKSSYRTDRYVGKNKWEKDISVKFWTLSNESIHMKSYRVDCKMVGSIYKNEYKK